jgi:RNA polymerase sigma factor (sigma-70 family)
MAMEREDRLAEIYRAHASDGLRLAYVLTGNREAAEDITQEAFVRIGRRLFGLRDLNHARAYLLRTIINLSRGRGRRLASERSALARLPAPETPLIPDIGQRDEIWTALLALPPRQRAALYLRYYLDHTEAQAAEALDCSSTALKSLVFRALTALRTSLQGDES